MNLFCECIIIILFAEELKHISEKLEETSTVKMELQLKLDELQSPELSIQVNTICDIIHHSFAMHVSHVFPRFLYSSKYLHVISVMLEQVEICCKMENLAHINKKPFNGCLIIQCAHRGCFAFFSCHELGSLSSQGCPGCLLT